MPSKYSLIEKFEGIYIWRMIMKKLLVLLALFTFISCGKSKVNEKATEIAQIKTEKKNTTIADVYIWMTKEQVGEILGEANNKVQKNGGEYEKWTFPNGSLLFNKAGYLVKKIII